MVKHEILRPEDLPRAGTLIAIDAEFVSLQQEEVEYRSDGTKKLIRPSRMALARVSVVRGEGEATGVPFIDDHIQVSEPIVDYLTEFSGIRRESSGPSRGAQAHIAEETTNLQLVIWRRASHNTPWSPQRWLTRSYGCSLTWAAHSSVMA